ncbi:MAG: pentapeptide repeat-containing protein [bacterium]
MKKFFVLIAFFISLVFSQKSTFAINYDYDLDSIIKKREKRDYNTIGIVSNKNLSSKTLTCKSLEYMDFKNCICKKTNFSGSRLLGCKFINCNLKVANFSKASFSDSSDFTKAKSVKDANFYRSTGLTNKQKKFLRKNGAINVPEDLSPDDEFIKACSSIAGLIAFVGIGSVVLHLISDL